MRPSIALLREFGLTTVFGNPGSTELPMFRDFPADFRYVLGLQESVVVAMADGFAQARGDAALVNLHSAIGVGHALGSIFTAYQESDSARDHRRPAGALHPAVRALSVFGTGGAAAEALREMEQRTGARGRRARGHRARLLHRDAAAARPHLRVDSGGRLGPTVRAAGGARRSAGAWRAILCCWRAPPRRCAIAGGR